MHRISTFAIGLLVATAGTGHAQELQNFTFRDAVAGEGAGEPKAFGKCKDGAVPGVRSCAEFSSEYGKEAGEVAGQPLVGIMAEVFNSRLTFIHGKFKKFSFEPIRAAFTAKYGEPCKTEAREFQTVMGAKSLSQRVIWCFKTGKLVLDEMSGNIREGSFIYADDQQAPKEAPKVDF